MKSKESKGASCWLDLKWTLVGTNAILSLRQPRPGLNHVELMVMCRVGDFVKKIGRSCGCANLVGIDLVLPSSAEYKHKYSCRCITVRASLRYLLFKGEAGVHNFLKT